MASLGLIRAAKATLAMGKRVCAKDWRTHHISAAGRLLVQHSRLQG